MKITPHQLRYNFGALLLDGGLPVAVVSRMMAHANEAITQGVYSHEILRRDSGDRTRQAMREGFGRGEIVERIVERSEPGKHGEAWGTGEAVSGGNVVSMPVAADG